MTTAKITTTKKAFLLSLAFHTSMALCALWMLNMSPARTQPFAVPIKHITLVSLSQTSALTPSPAAPKSPQVLPETPRPLVSAQTKPIPLKLPDRPPEIPVTKPHALPAADPSPSMPLANSKPNINTPAVQVPSKSPAPARPAVDVNAEMNALKASLRLRIQQQLRYPSAARRRGMEGSVAVRFHLDPSGTIRDISVLRGEGLFHNAAKLAVASASGINIPDTLSDSLPREMELTLEFRLNGAS